MIGLAFLAGAVAGCNDDPFGRSHETFGMLFGMAFSGDSTSTHRDACTLNGTWQLPAWPATSRSDLITINFTRQVVLPQAQATMRSQIYRDVPIQMTRTDSLHLVLVIGAPFEDTLSGVLQPVVPDNFSFTSAWQCRSRFPLADDSTLLANGYQPDSLGLGTATLDRLSPID